MTRRTSEDALADSARGVVGAETLKRWITGPLKSVLPHDAMSCRQTIHQACGRALTRWWCFGLPRAYEAVILAAGGPMPGPILNPLQSNEPEFFEFGPNNSSHVADPLWRVNFRLAGWRNLLVMAHGEEDGLVCTSAAFYNVGPQAIAQRRAMQRVMPSLHEALSRLRDSSTKTDGHGAGPRLLALSGAEGAIVDLLVEGRTNKEIARLLGKSSETVKYQLKVLMRRTSVRNRTELVHLVSSTKVLAP